MTCEDRCQKVRGGVNMMEVSGVWSWRHVVRDTGVESGEGRYVHKSVSGGQVSGGERSEGSEWNEWR
jgi:hypothetical protein